MLSEACESCRSLVCPYHDASLPVWDNGGSVTLKKIAAKGTALTFKVLNTSYEKTKFFILYL